MFLLGGKVLFASWARSVTLTQVYRSCVGGEVAPAAECCAALLALEVETSVVSVSAAGLICLVTAKVT